MKTPGELYEEAMGSGAELIDAIRFKGLKTEKAAKRLEKLLDKFEKAWNKQTNRK